MSIPVNCIIRSATRKSTDPLNILWFPHDGLFEMLLCGNLPHNYYGSHDLETLPWDTTLFPYTKTFYKLPNYNSFSMDVDFDLVVCNNRMSQYKQAKVLASTLHLPLLTIDHTIPSSVMKREDIHLVMQNTPSDISITCSDQLNTRWHTAHTIIPYGIPDLYKDGERKNQILLAGRFDPKDIQKIQPIIDGSDISIKIIGNDKQHAYDDLIHEFQTSRYYLNLALNTTTPLIMLLAMSAGCIPITNDTIFTTRMIRSGLDGIVFKDTQDLHSQIKRLAQIPETDLEKMSHEAHVLIQEHYDQQSFIQLWQKVFQQIYPFVYTRK